MALRGGLVLSALFVAVGPAAAQDEPPTDVAPAADAVNADDANADSANADSRNADSVSADDANADDANADDANADDASADDASADDANADDVSVDDASADDIDGTDDAGDTPGQDTAARELPEGHRPTLTVEVQAPENGLHTGDVVRLLITAVLPAGDDISIPEQGFDPFELHDSSHEASPDGEQQRVEFRLDLLALEPGEHTLAAVRLRVVTADGVVGEASTEPQTIVVDSYLGNEPDAEPRPATEPVEVFEDDYTLAWVLGILGTMLLVALLAFLLGHWWRKRPKPAAPPPPPKPPWEIALAQLEALKKQQREMLASGNEVEFVDRVSDVLREYLGGRYAFNGLESTSDEVVARLRGVKLRRVRLEDIQALLADSDLVKFARAVPDADQCERMLQGAFHIVHATAPRTGESATPERRSRPRKKKPKAAPSSSEPVTLRTGHQLWASGEIMIPIDAATLEEAQRAIGHEVGKVARDLMGEPRFNGRIRVRVGPALESTDEVVRALRSVRAQLSDELDALRTQNGAALELIIELDAPPVAGGEVHDVEDSLDDAEPAKAPPGRGVESLRAVSAADTRAPSNPAPANADTLIDTPLAPEEASARDESGPPETEPLRGEVVPRFVSKAAAGSALLRWVTGLPLPLAYARDDDHGLLEASDLRRHGVSRNEVHERAVRHAETLLPPGFEPGSDPAVLDDGAIAIVALSSRVPKDETWIAVVLEDGTLIVMREDEDGTDDELARLAREPGMFEQPVRVRATGFAPYDWPAGARERETNPGFATDDADDGGTEE